MELVRTFSHLNGEEHLLVNKPALYHELIELLRLSRLRTLENSRNSSGVLLLRDFRQIFHLLAQTAGWQKSATGLERERISMSVHVPLGGETLSFGRLFAEQLWSYAVGNIDVGVEILPAWGYGIAGRTKKNLRRPADGFSGAVSEIRQFGRNVPPVPLLLLGVSLQSS
jgi:hypothetical protein